MYLAEKIIISLSRPRKNDNDNAIRIIINKWPHRLNNAVGKCWRPKGHVRRTRGRYVYRYAVRLTGKNIGATSVQRSCPSGKPLSSPPGVGDELA